MQLSNELGRTGALKYREPSVSRRIKIKIKFPMRNAASPAFVADHSPTCIFHLHLGEKSVRL